MSIRDFMSCNPKTYFRLPAKKFRSKEVHELTREELEYIHRKVVCTTTGLQESEIASANPEYCLIEGTSLIELKFNAYLCGFRVLRSLITTRRISSASDGGLHIATPVMIARCKNDMNVEGENLDSN